MDFEYLILLATLMAVPILGCSQNNHRHTELHDTDSATEPLHGTETETTITLPTDTEPPEPPRGYVSPEGELKTGDIWGRAFGGDGWCNIQAVAIGPDESVYATGWFSGTVDFDPRDGEELHTSPALEATFLTRFSNHGEHQWTLSWGAADATKRQGLGDIGWTIAISDQGEIYLGGQIGGTVDLNPGPEEDKHYAKGYDSFILKLAPDTEFEWAHSWGGEKGRVTSAFLMDNKLVISGQSTSDALFNIDNAAQDALEWGDYNEAGQNRVDCYVAQMDTDGQTEWVRVWGGLYDDKGCTSHPLTDGFVAYTHDAMYIQDLDPGPDEEPAYPEYFSGPVLLGFDSQGEKIFGDHFRDTTGSYMTLRALATQGNTIYAAGYFLHYGSLDLGTAESPDVREPISDVQDAFLVRIELDGTHPWAKTWSGTGESSARATHLKTTENSIVVVGKFAGEVNFGTSASPLVETTDDQEDNSFIMAVDPSGNIVKVDVLRGESNYASAIAIKDGNAVVGGAFYDDIDLDMGAGPDIWDSPGLYACYLVRFPLE